MGIPKQITDVVAATKVALIHPDAPLYYAWVFDPRDTQVHISDDHQKPRRLRTHHKELAEKAGNHPSRVHGYAYRIQGGWRITDHEHKKVDGFIAKRVVSALAEKESTYDV